MVLPLSLFCLENRVCLSRGVQVTCAAWWIATRIVARVGDLMQRTGMVAHVGYSVVGRSGGRVTLCAIYTVHVKTRSTCFLVEPQNQSWWFVCGLTSKLLG
jgi:hypothetical protein